MKQLNIISTILLGGVIGLSANAEVFDASLVSPGGTAPGWYDGSGNPNGGFAVDTENGIEIGLRAKLRQDPNVIDSLNGVYIVPPGAQPGSPSHAAWNYEWSIDLNPGGGAGGLTLSGITATLVITDVTRGVSETVNPLNVNPLLGPPPSCPGYVCDDAEFGPSGKVGAPPSNPTQDWGAQNSENPIFANFLPGYDENAGDTYTFDLTVNSAANGAQLATDSIVVEVTPEPSTFVLLAGAGLVGLGLLRRRKSIV